MRRPGLCDYAEDDILRCMEDILPVEDSSFYDEKNISAAPADSGCVFSAFALAPA